MAPECSNEDLERLSRYVDGELPAAESRQLEARLRDEPMLRSVLVQLEGLNHQLRDLLAERDEVPGSVTALLEDTSVRQPETEDWGNNVVNFPGTPGAAAATQRPRWAYAMAASFALVAAVSLVYNANQNPGLPGNDALVSAALDTQPSGSDWMALGDGRELQPVLTFPHEDGSWCREYLLRGGSADWRSVACRQEGRWVTQAAGLESFLDSSDAYRAAGAEDSASVAVFISQNAADIALGADEERALISGRWK